MSEVIDFPRPKAAHRAELSRCYTTAPFIWLKAMPAKDRPGRFVYVVGVNHWPLSKLFTYNLATARAAAESFGVPVREAGPPEAFGRTEKTPAASTIDAFFHVVRSGDHEYLSTWLRDHADDAPALLRMVGPRK